MRLSLGRLQSESSETQKQRLASLALQLMSLVRLTGLVRLVCLNKGFLRLCHTRLMRLSSCFDCLERLLLRTFFRFRKDDLAFLISFTLSLPALNPGTYTLTPSCFVLCRRFVEDRCRNASGQTLVNQLTHESCRFDSFFGSQRLKQFGSGWIEQNL